MSTNHWETVDAIILFVGGIVAHIVATMTADGGYNTLYHFLSITSLSMIILINYQKAWMKILELLAKAKKILLSFRDRLRKTISYFHSTKKNKP